MDGNDDYLNVEVRGMGVVGRIERTGNDEADIQASYDYLMERGLLKDATKAQFMFNQAVSFNHTAAMLYGHGLFPKPPKPDFAAPFAVNSAFAAELFLKTLSHAHGNDQRGHKLLDIHKNLPRRAKSDLEAATPPMLQQRALPLRPFRDLLLTINSAFEDWRYLYEHDGKVGAFAIQDAIAALNVLHRVAQEKIWPGSPVTFG